jgi:hypothetical protein
MFYKTTLEEEVDTGDEEGLAAREVRLNLVTSPTATEYLLHDATFGKGVTKKARKVRNGSALTVL